MNKKSKKYSVVSVLVVVMGVIILGSVFVYSYIRSRNTPQYFNVSKKGKAERLYDGIMKHDLDNSYPGSPDVVMEIYNDTIELIYGDMIRDETILQNTVEQQRKLLTPRLTEDNSFEEQMAALTEALEILSSDGIYCIETDQKIPIYDPVATNKCLIRTTHVYVGVDNVYRNYYFIRNPENGRWQIDEWELTDENFQPITGG